jgi:hypothetical protein
MKGSAAFDPNPSVKQDPLSSVSNAPAEDLISQRFKQIPVLLSDQDELSILPKQGW